MSMLSGRDCEHAGEREIVCTPERERMRVDDYERG